MDCFQNAFCRHPKQLLCTNGVLAPLLVYQVNQRKNIRKLDKFLSTILLIFFKRPHLETANIPVPNLALIKKIQKDRHAPPTNSKPSAAGSSWKGGAKERSAVLRRSPKGTALKRSGADFAPTWTKAAKSIFFRDCAQNQIEAQRSGFDLERRSSAMSAL